MKKIAMFLAVAGLVLTVWIGSASGGSWTVGSGGDFATIQAAVDAAQPNDDIRVLSGTYTEMVTVNTSNLKIWAAPGETAIVSGEDTRNYGIDLLAGADGAVIEGLEIKSTIYSGGGAGIALHGGADNVTVRDCYIHNNSNNGIQTFGDGTLAGISDSLVVENCRLEYNGDSGVKLYGSSHVTIHSNTFVQNEDYGVLAWNYHTPGGYTMDDIQVLGNHMRTNGYGVKIDGDDADGMTNVLLAFNDMFYGSDCGIRLDDYVAGAQIYNNTIDWYQDCGIMIEDASDNAVLRNNILSECAGYGIVQEDSAGADTYAFIRPPGDAADSGLTEGLNSIYLNPLFEDPPRPPDYGTWDYTLGTGSPCIDAGIDVGYAYIGTAPDMGAFEVPEPATLSLLALGGVAALIRRRRK